MPRPTMVSEPIVFTIYTDTNRLPERLPAESAPVLFNWIDVWLQSVDTFLRKEFDRKLIVSRDKNHAAGRRYRSQS